MYNYTQKWIQILTKYFSLLENKKQISFGWLKLSSLKANMDAELLTLINHLIIIFLQAKLVT